MLVFTPLSKQTQATHARTHKHQARDICASKQKVAKEIYHKILTTTTTKTAVTATQSPTISFSHHHCLHFLCDARCVGETTFM